MRLAIVAIALGVVGCKADKAPPAPPPTPEPADPPPSVPVDAAAVAPIDAAPIEPGAFVDPTTLDDTLRLDIRYATTNNFAKRVVYPVARCLLRGEVAEALVRGQKRLAAQGYSLLIWDCYRPFSVQEAFWKLVPDGRYVARPVRKDGVPHKGSKHNRGAAVDVSLVKADGTLLDVPTDHDDFSERAHRGSSAWSADAKKHSAILTEALTAEGFGTIETEWWHFDYKTWRNYELADEPLEAK